MITMIELDCEQCGCKFKRRAAEHNRNQRKGRRVFCGRSCQGRELIKAMPFDKRTSYDISVHAGHKKDEYTPFRYFLKNAKQHAKDRAGAGSIVEITLEELKEQWEKQQGICPYTGWQLQTNQMSSQSYKNIKTPDRASLDRVDSSKGYIKGNIQFIAFMANVAKNDFHEDELIRFCKAVAQNKG